MKYFLDINDRPFKAIKAGTKIIEGRTSTNKGNVSYDKFQKGDFIVFTNNVTGEVLETEILFVHHYSNTRIMLEIEGSENVLSDEPKTVEHGIESYNSFEGYKEGIKKNGIYAIGIKVI